MRLALFLFFNRQSHTLSDVFSSFALGLRFDLRIVSIIMLIMLVLGSIRFLSPFRSRVNKKIWNILVGLTAFVIVLFYLLDFAHYAYLSQRLNASVMNYLDDAAISMSMVWQSYPVIWIVLGLALATFLIVFVRNYFMSRIGERGVRSEERGVRSKMFVRIGWFLFFFFAFSFFIFGRFNQYPLRWSDAFQLGDDYKAQLALNPFESFFNTMRYRHSKYDEKKVAEYYPFLSKYYDFDTTTGKALNFSRRIHPADTFAVKPNVVLVICESFSAYKSSMHGNPLDATPFFNQMVKNGVYFDHCFTPTYGTARGVWAVITSIPDVEIANTASRNPAAVDQHTIINDLHGYEKFYFIGGSASWANIRGVLTNNIQDLHLYEEEDFKAGRIDVWGISDKNLLLEANKVLSTQRTPFFAIIQTADNHRPYTIPEEDLDEFQKKTFPSDSVVKYGFENNDELNAFRYTDFCFQKFMEAAQKEQYFENTVFVFVGDHGIAGNAGDMFPAAWTAQRLTSEHVPLLFYAPKILQPQRISRIASQIDVVPTVAGIIKASHTNSSLGRDLLDPKFFDKDFALIFDPDSRMVGVMDDSFYYRKSFVLDRDELVSIRKNNEQAKPQNKEQLKILTNAMFETSKYLLLNNKKK